MKHVTTKTEDHEPSSFGPYAVEIFYFASLGASIAGALVATLASSLTFEGLRKSSSELNPARIFSIRRHYSIRCRRSRADLYSRATFYKNRLHSRARLTERVRVLEKSFFEIAERDLDALIAAHGRR